MYKLIGTNTASQLNSANPYAEVFFDDAVLYPNPYMVITPKGYTKHYYAGADRLATVIGMGGFINVIEPEDQLLPTDGIYLEQFHRYLNTNDPFHHSGVISVPAQMEDIEGNPRPELGYDCGPVVLNRLDILSMQNILYYTISCNEKDNGLESDVYFYHGDHLGSANWITDANGLPVQYIHYAPYGELIDNQTPYLYEERYKFTGKGRDEETGYDYFGARYLSSILSHWLSVDPLSDKYPSISPYAYCAWNPVKYVDPDGEEPNKAYIGTVSDFIQVLNNSQNKVGFYTNRKAIQYISKLGNIKFNIRKLKVEPTETGYFNKKKGRYIYTQKGGWIDMAHFMFYAGKAYKHKIDGLKNPVGEAVQEGFWQERLDQFMAPHSSYSYEDLPSDRYGAIFGAEYFNPNSEQTLGEQLEQYLNDVLQATEPFGAPNYNELPIDDNNKRPTHRNTTTKPMFTDEGH